VPYLASEEIPTVIDQAGTTSLTQEDGNPYVFRTSYTNEQQHLPMGEYAFNQLGYEKVGIVALGYAAGDEMAAAFREQFEAAGGSVVYESFVELGTTDMASFITEALNRADEVDGLAVILFGPPAIQWVNQSAEFGLRDEVDYFCLGCTLDGLYLPAEGENALGVVSYQNWAADADFEANREFQAAYEAATGEPANVAAYAGYLAAQVVGEALAAIDGAVEDKTAFLEALQAVEFEGPGGPFRFDEDQNAVITVFIMQTEMVDGEVRNVVIDSVPDVDQYYGD
jgi:branched-chain amino acid transport system substrate-binding protein